MKVGMELLPTMLSHVDHWGPHRPVVLQWTAEYTPPHYPGSCLGDIEGLVFGRHALYLHQRHSYQLLELHSGTSCLLYYCLLLAGLGTPFSAFFYPLASHVVKITQQCFSTKKGVWSILHRWTLTSLAKSTWSTYSSLFFILPSLAKLKYIYLQLAVFHFSVTFYNGDPNKGAAQKEESCWTEGNIIKAASSTVR